MLLKKGVSTMLESYLYWISEFKMFMVQDTLMFAWFCVYMGAACQWLYERVSS